jgi:hypothetical protein
MTDSPRTRARPSPVPVGTLLINKNGARKNGSTAPLVRQATLSWEDVEWFRAEYPDLPLVLKVMLRSEPFVFSTAHRLCDDTNDKAD